MKIRRMRPGEGKRLAELLYSSVHRLCADVYTPEELEAWAPKKMDTAKLTYSLMRNVTWVMEDGGRPVGFVCIERDGYVNRLFTHPDYTGRGVATELMDTAAAWAKKHGINRIFLASSRVGYGFYMKYGFRVCGVDRVERRGVTFENRVMEKFI